MSFYLAFITGLFASAHCIGMCGGVITALSQSSIVRKPTENQFHLLLLNTGRISIYVLMGFILSLLTMLVGIGAESLNISQWGLLLRQLTAIMLILIGLQIAFNIRFTWLETLGSHPWKRLQPIVKTLLPASHYRQTYLLGMAWGFLPCSLVYSVLLIALGSNSPLQGATIMLGFGLGTLPALLLTGNILVYFRRLIKLSQTRIIAGLILCLAGLWLSYHAFMPNHHHHQAHSHTNTIKY